MGEREIPDDCIGCQNIFEDSTVVATSGDKYFCPRENSEQGKEERQIGRNNLGI